VSSSLRDWELLRDPALRAVFSALDGEGRATRIVGGAVRDALLNRRVTDADLATIFLPDEVIERAEAAGLKTAPTGIEHGTVTVISAGRPFQVTTLRRDIETDGRRAVVRFTKDWGRDASRRDFTMNALYCDLAGIVLDPLGGIEDLHAGRVRFIGNAEDRIEEDYLRILRFFRFFAWYGAGRPDSHGLRACARLKAGLASLSAERVWAELKRLLSAPDPARALLWMRSTEILQTALPESWGIDAIHRLVAAERQEAWEADPLLRLEAILPPHRPRIDALASRLKLSRAEAARLIGWADAPEPDPGMEEGSLGKLLYCVSRDGVLDRLKHAIAREGAAGNTDACEALKRQMRFTESWERPKFPLSGKDLVAAGMEAGPEVGKRLKELEERWVESSFVLSREELLA
jgi:poly(A) polymerase/tRNA nucleotidyltransferase (CCA-adding enzyme)